MKHWLTIYWEKHRTEGCKFKGCSVKHYAKGYCKSHWAKLRRGTLVSKFCKGCGRKFSKGERYCYLCLRKRQTMEKFGIPKTKENFFKDLRRLSKLGENNPRWHGGVSEYPNHSQMKRTRKTKIKLAKGKCELCGDLGRLIHHKDKTKTNHSLENLLFVCYKCHAKLHPGKLGRPKGSKNKKSKRMLDTVQGF